MTKVSDNAKGELNKFGDFYFTLFSLLAFFYVTTAWLLDFSDFSAMQICLSPVVAFVLYKWLTGRYKIIKNNKKDVKREQAIKDCREDCFIDVNITEEVWIDKYLTSIRFFNAEESDKFQKNIFSYKFFLDKENTLGVYQAVEAIVFLDNSDDIVMIDGIDHIAFMLSTSKIKLLLERLFHFIRWQYYNERDLSVRDYTFNAIKDLGGYVSAKAEKVVLKAQKDALKIFQSGEKFQVAGEVVKGGNGKKLFLITAVKTETQDIVLFPVKMVKSIFAGLNNITSTR